MPTKVLKTKAMFTAKTLYRLFNQALNTGGFPLSKENLQASQLYIYYFKSISKVDVKPNKTLDNNSYGGEKLMNLSKVFLMDLSKVFNTLNHDLLIATFYEYGFNIKILKLLHSFLTKRSKNRKIKKIQVLVHGQSCYKASLKFLFYSTEMTQLCNSANDILCMWQGFVYFA